MFDFENLDVYKKTKVFNHATRKFLQNVNFDLSTKSQLRRASMSIALNIAEGSGRNSKKDKRKYYIISRGSVFECVAILEILMEEGWLKQPQYLELYTKAEELSKMLYSMIKSLEN